ncbi:hypothetical protein [Flavobacterium xinjiangense]|uniref:Lipoprotein n=1 Tax=Flavobacterium xinjiangense TaxID=178356 RepID=A0A1M7PMU1_9FLAO|nr:hypothetical protein [Flavobacterium xinjiangense]SHN18566.1 hypothetical protein SAMN05216269_1204 [Flavobacterium xinjiangense]
MKIIYLIFILTFFIGCNDKTRNFEGIGQIKLGSNFDSLPSSKLFKNHSGNEYTIDSFKLSNEIGFVKNLNIKTDNGIIYDVSFNNSETTNISAIDSLMKNFHKFNLINIAENKSSPIQIFEETDGVVDFSKIVTKNNSQPIDYRYFDIKKVVNKADEN